MRIFAKIAAVILCTVLIAVAAAFIFYFSVTAGERLDTTKLEQTQNSACIYDALDSKIAEVSFKNASKSVSAKDIPAHVKNAFIAAEDKNFYKHHGLDYRGIARAVFKNLRAHSFKQGGSTISQQLVKNTQLTSEKTIVRKLKEIKLTKQLENKYTKDQILEMYLNSIYFGHACYGIAGAAEFYFGKSVSELTIDEGAMLAAVIRSPSNYSPFSNPEKCLSARNDVLRKMFALGYITESDCENASNQPLPTQHDATQTAGTYISAVYEELETLPFYDPYKFLDGCKIYTYMDSSLQSYTENLNTDADRSGKSILILNNDSCGVSAYFTSEGNIARQPGSVIKPLAVYAPAIEENIISPATPILDEKTNFAGYQPSNYRDIYSGYVSARDALSQSMNVPAVKILNELGVDTSERYLRRVGLQINEKDKSLALALGGISEGFTLQEVAAAYATFANGGIYTRPAFIREIRAEDGTILYSRKQENSRVYSEDTAYLVNDMLRSTATIGTAKKLASLPYYICAKTGTCGTEKGNTDAWTISYTTKHTVGFWMGNADNSLTDITGGGLPCHYALLLNKKIYENDIPTQPALCDSVTECRLDKASYERDHVLRLAAQNQPDVYTFTDLFRSNNVPTETGAIFTNPSDNPKISYKNNAITIELCQTEYYDYLVKKCKNGKTIAVFDGKLQTIFRDTDIERNQIYTYSITPYFIGANGEKIYGEEILLPAVNTKKNTSTVPDHWWEK